MQKKWYFGIFISVLAMLVIVQQQTVVPNQEIVLEFLNTEISPQEIQKAIASVKTKLRRIGVKHTRVYNHSKEGALKITYYSDADIDVIKKILSETQNISLDHTAYDHENKSDHKPSDKPSRDYELKISEIQKSIDFNPDFKSVFASKTYHKRNGSVHHHSFSFLRSLFSTHTHQFRYGGTTLKGDKTITLAIKDVLYQIPEGRAGPFYLL
ncbi:hypothetical protein J8281_08290 [Aquimarina sp. U1-2]|uniref:hypothetical protein n=1 Tax=Aquimarina sp. U1-2 TaxID=2823141 RepID=UPI001AECA3A3|nr:hypothetical protein [Aquimarina sp. U1-2]MBP2832186.1 hypothetical protein [Aquimarina sp. U1-2]